LCEDPSSSIKHYLPKLQTLYLQSICTFCAFLWGISDRTVPHQPTRSLSTSVPTRRCCRAGHCCVLSLTGQPRGQAGRCIYARARNLGCFGGERAGTFAGSLGVWTRMCEAGSCHANVRSHWGEGRREEESIWLCVGYGLGYSDSCQTQLISASLPKGCPV
jgi:hypothetical protein